MNIIKAEKRRKTVYKSSAFQLDRDEDKRKMESKKAEQYLKE